MEQAQPPPSTPLVLLVSDVVIKLIFVVPALRTKLEHLLKQPTEVYARVKQLYNDIIQSAAAEDMKQLEVYLTQCTPQSSLIHVFETAFQNIFADGQVDLNDSIHFMALIHGVVTCFNKRTQTRTPPTAIHVSSDCVILFLKFALKCIFALTLDDAQERQAVQLVDHSFQLLQLTVAPITLEVPHCTSCRCTLM